MSNNKNYTFKIEDSTGRPHEHRIDIWASSPTEAYGQLCLQRIGEPGHIRIASCSVNNNDGTTGKVNIPKHTLLITGVAAEEVVSKPIIQLVHVNWVVWEDLARAESWDGAEIEVEVSVPVVEKPVHVSTGKPAAVKQWRNFFPQAKEVSGKVVYYISDLKNRTYLHKGAFEMVSAMTDTKKYVFDTQAGAIDKIAELESELEITSV